MRMIKMRKLLSAVLCCVLAFTMLFACTQATPEKTPQDSAHVCKHVCEECGKCLDKKCKDEVCKNKCKGHSAEHACAHKCEECDKCLDEECDEEACEDKCKGHPAEHICAHKCEVCRRCLDKECGEKACENKCRGHEPAKHRCSHVCPVCGDCLDENCDEPVCKDKCDADHYAHEAAMPIIRIDTTDGSNDFLLWPDRNAKLRDEIEYVGATVTVEDDGLVSLDGVEASVKARGNYTLNYPKKPIRIKFNKKQSVLGLNDGTKFKSWVLLADWKDLSMSNNATALYLAKSILGEDGYYSSDYRFVDVYLNGQYWGVYLLVEQQEAKGDDGRSSAPATPDDYTGTDIGYLVEYDGYYTDERNMPNNAGDPTFEMHYHGGSDLTKLNGTTLAAQWAQKGYTVKSDIYSDTQVQFINTFMDVAYKIAYDAVYYGYSYKFTADYSEMERADDLSTVEAVSAVIDVQSLADMYILSEIACDPDLAWSSFYISLDMTESGSKKLIFEAPWDFDSAFGIKNGFVNNGRGMYAANCDNPWLVLLIREKWFQDIVTKKWNDMLDNGVTTGALQQITDIKRGYEECFAANFTRWERRITGGNSELVWELNTYTTQAQAADYLYNWLETRFAYLDAQWNGSWGGSNTNIPAEPEEGSTRYRIEAEDCDYDYPIDVSTWHSEWASGGAFLGEIDGTNGKRIMLTVYAEEDCTAFLSVCLSKRSFSAVFTDWFTVSVNGEMLYDMPPRLIPACSSGEIEWVAWTDVGLMPIELEAGINVITFTTTGGKSTNVDYFDLWSKTTLSLW
ncbi:MAG: CotH kinase family protein [Clostridiales bacterium]|nr:CotH kinase family protein [Clostridiales bacterium]